MGNFFDKFILSDEEERDETFSVLELCVNHEHYYPILTSDENGDMEYFYLFNFIKIYQKKQNNKLTTHDITSS